MKKSLTEKEIRFMSKLELKEQYFFTRDDIKNNLNRSAVTRIAVNEEVVHTFFLHNYLWEIVRLLGFSGNLILFSRERK